MRILITDDDLTNRLVVRLLMELRGFSVLEASGGNEAAHVLSEESVDAVFMDIHMPEMDGYDSTRMLRAGVLGDRIPVFALTSATSDETRQKCIDSGMNGFIRKPFDAGMAEQVHQALERWGAGGDSATWLVG